MLDGLNEKKNVLNGLTVFFKVVQTRFLILSLGSSSRQPAYYRARFCRWRRYREERDTERGKSR